MDSIRLSVAEYGLPEAVNLMPSSEILSPTQVQVITGRSRVLANWQPVALRAMEILVVLVMAVYEPTHLVVNTK